MFSVFILCAQPEFIESERVRQFMTTLPTLPAAGNLASTSIRTVGTYASWLNRHPDMLPQHLTFVSQGLAQTSI